MPPVAAWEPADRVLTAGDDRLDRVADAFAQVIDAKSPFTARHSAEVARWAVEIGAVLGMRAEELRDLRRAGLLHDIGKLAVSNRILDKPGRLERRRDRRHPRASALHAADPRARRMLARDRRDRGLAPRTAGRQRLPPRADRRSLSRPARMLAVADICEALTAERPTARRCRARRRWRSCVSSAGSGCARPRSMR